MQFLSTQSRQALPRIFLSLTIACSLLLSSVAGAKSAKPILTYIGTYTGARSKGVYLARFDPQNGTLSAPELVYETKNPSFLALHPNHHILFAAGEVDEFNGKKGGMISALRIDAATGKLSLINQQSTVGTGPCHLSVDAWGKCVLVANYGSGSVAALPIESAGELGEPTSFIQHSGSSVNRQRQTGPHAHFITADPGNKFALACDLGLDKVLVYKLRPATSTLTPNDPPSVAIKPGAGPRHLAFHPSGKFVYVISEMGSSITTLAYDAKHGALKEIQTVSTLPNNFNGESTCAEIQIHPSGKFVYGSNRGADSIAVFAVEKKSGMLKPVEFESTQGKTPRHFAIDPTGQWLLAENQNSNSIVVFRIDDASGRLKPNGQSIEVGAPVCVQFVGQ